MVGASDKTASKAKSLREVVRRQGRSLKWLAEQTGYSPEHVQRVARGDAPGTTPFHLSMERVLGESYEWPRGVKRPEAA